MAQAPWDGARSQLGAVIKARHYSPKTLKSYSHWARKLQSFKKDREPSSLTSEDVKDFLTYLAVQCRVSASSQNQAFNALLFFFRHVLEKDFGEIRDVVRAKRRPYIPVVLSRQEVEAAFLEASPLPPFMRREERKGVFQEKTRPWVSQPMLSSSRNFISIT